VTWNCDKLPLTMKMRSTKSKVTGFSRGVTQGSPTKVRRTVETLVANKNARGPNQKSVVKVETNSNGMSKADQMTLKAWQATYDSRDKFVR
jgi:hypothetical protein